MPPKLHHEPRQHAASIRSDPWCEGPSPCVVEGSGVPFDGFAPLVSAEPALACAEQSALLMAQSPG